jgi:hypothetical protein
MDTAGYALSVGKDAADAGYRGDVDSVQTRQKALQDAHVAFRNRTQSYIPELEATGYDATKFRRIDQAFVDARKMAGDTNAYGGFGAEGAARQLVGNILEGKVERGAMYHWTSPEGYRASISPMESSIIRESVVRAEEKALRDIFKARKRSAGFDTPAGMERAKQSLIAMEVARTAETDNPRTAAEVSAAIDRKLSEAREAAISVVVRRVQDGFAKQTARKADTSQAGQAANAAADALYQ